MKKWTVALGLAVAVTLVVGLRAQEKKEVTLKGTLVCGKCTLGETAKCANVLKVKDGDKEVLYYLDDDGNKAKYHKPICPAGSEKQATVKGTVTEKDGKKMLKPTSPDAVKLE